MKWLAPALMLMWAWQAFAALPIQITDDRGRTLSFQASPLRVVSVLPSLTEVVCALDRCERLVGVDRYSNWPASVGALPKVGGGIDPSLEAIVALRPDVVLVAGSARLSDRLEQLGIRVVQLEPKTHADVRRSITVLAKLLEAKDAAQVWRNIDAGVAAAAQSLTAQQRAQRVYFEVGRGPYAASASSFIGETLARLGVHNVVPANLGPFPKLNPEFVVRANPDLILASAQELGELAKRPGWEHMQAVKNGRLCGFSQEDADVLVRPGPRMAQAARAMANCLAKPWS